MTNDKIKCGIIYKKIAIQAGDDEQKIMSGLSTHQYHGISQTWLWLQYHVVDMLNFGIHFQKLC